MSLLDDVSIVVTPNGVKASKLYAVIPSNGDADMDVTRATAATRVDENGLVNYAEVITGSNIITDGDFPNGSTAWALNGWTISDNAANGNGLTANMIQTISGSTNKTYSLTFTISNYVSGSIIPAFVGGSNYSKVYNANGTFTEVISSYSDTRFVFYASSFDGSVDNVSVKEVTRDNVPRIDYTGGGCPHILAEPQRTNTTTRSNELDLWGAKSNVTITPDYSLSPDGSINSNRLLFSANGFTHNNLTQVISTIYSISVYAKRNSGTENVGFFVNGSGAVDYAFNLTNEWQRFEYTYTSTNTSTFGIAGLSGADVSIFGFQSEVGSYATSYIPTSGSTVTRNQDIFTRDGIGSLINSTEGTLFLELAANNVTTFKNISINSDGSNRVNFFIYTSSVTVNFDVGGVTQASLSYSIPDVTSFNKFAFTYKLNEFKLFVNGTKRATDTSGIVPSANTFDTVSFNDSFGNNFYGKVKQLQVYNTALTDEQLTSLTS